MGNCQSDPETKRSKRLESEINTMKRAEGQVMKVLLLGAGESGKSTIFKQMKLIHKDEVGYTQEDRMAFVATVHQNTIHNAKELVKAANKFGYTSEQLTADAAQLAQVDDHGPLTPEIAALLTGIWREQPIQDTYKRKSEFQLADSTQYFFQNLDRISASGYIPTDQDLLRTRVKTSGIVEMSFTMGGTEFRLFDVGGQRNERRKWIHCFDNVQAVLFVAAISEYDQGLYEDEDTNRLREALSLFSEICNSRFFTNTSMILFLNKRDLFEEKIKTVPLRDFFPEFHGSSVQDSIQFIEQQFTDLNKNPHKQVYPHVTCATDTNNISFVFDAVKDTILTQNLKTAGFM